MKHGTSAGASLPDLQRNLVETSVVADLDDLVRSLAVVAEFAHAKASARFPM